MQTKPIYKNEDWTGRKSGSLTVIGYGEPYIYKRAGSNRKCTTHKWKVQCDCGKIYLVQKQHITDGGQVGCVDCLSKRINLTQSPLWKSSSKFLPGIKYSGIKWSAKNRNLEFNISREYLDDLFQKQNGKCVYLDEALVFGKGRFGNASLDRIDSSKGYIEGNVQWVHKDVNILKWTLTHERFIEMCQKVAKKFNGN